MAIRARGPPSDSQRQIEVTMFAVAGSQCVEESLGVAVRGLLPFLFFSLLDVLDLLLTSLLHKEPPRISLGPLKQQLHG